MPFDSRSLEDLVLNEVAKRADLGDNYFDLNTVANCIVELEVAKTRLISTYFTFTEE